MKRRFVLAVLLLGLPASWAAAQVPAGGEFQVNTYTTNDQGVPSVALDASGNFVVVWQSLGQDGDGAGVFAQRFDASGARKGSEFQVNTYTTKGQYEPVVATDAAGRFVVVWGDYYSYEWPNHDGTWAQLYSSDGSPRGSEFYTGGFLDIDSLPHLALASDPHGNFTVVWDGHVPGLGWLQSISAQRFDASGTPRGTGFQVNSQRDRSVSSPAVASDAAGNLLFVWQRDSDYLGPDDVFGRRFDASGMTQGLDFQVNSYTPSDQGGPKVAADRDGNFVVVWQSSSGQDGSFDGVFARRYDHAGAPLGPEFAVNTYTTGDQFDPAVASDAAGNFVVVWADGGRRGIFGQRFDSFGTRRGAEFQASANTTFIKRNPSVSSDGAGNVVAVWESYGQDGSATGVFGQRFGGLLPAALAVDATAWAGADGNGVLEAGESVEVAPAWHNANGASWDLFGGILDFGGPAGSGVSYELQQAVAVYGTVADGTTVPCAACYQLGVSTTGTRPATHWDATLTERLSPDSLGETMPWRLHVGESFTDVPRTSPYYRSVETLLHNGVTAGCSGGTYCPADSVTRQQMAVFALLAKEKQGYLPSPCTTPMFADVPASSPYCRWIEEAARRGVVMGCGGGNYCPGGEVSREQMPVFMLRTLEPALDPPACTTPMFDDVPASSPYCRWIEELARRGVVAGCGDGNYCPASAVSREQMAVFVSATFGLTLYGP